MGRVSNVASSRVDVGRLDHVPPIKPIDFKVTQVNSFHDFEIDGAHKFSHGKPFLHIFGQCCSLFLRKVGGLAMDLHSAGFAEGFGYYAIPHEVMIQLLLSLNDDLVLVGVQPSIAVLW